MSRFLAKLETPAIQESSQLPVNVYVVKHPEQFRYRAELPATAVPIAYAENPQINANQNLHVVNRTYTIPVNGPTNLMSRSGWQQVRGTALSTDWRYMVVTNRIGQDVTGQAKPLFWRHILPSNTISVKMTKLTNGNALPLESGYVVDLDIPAVFTNYENTFDPNTGSYQLYYLAIGRADGTVVNELLNPISAVREATWEDIDPDTGMIYEGLAVYEVSENASDFTYCFNLGGEYWAKPWRKSLIQPLTPTGYLSVDQWLPRFSQGHFWANGKRYWLPEYNDQAFVPCAPYRMNTEAQLIRINGSAYKLPHELTAISPLDSRHILICVYDVDDSLVRVLTSNPDLVGTRYRSTAIEHELSIISWDNAQGIIQLGDRLPASYRLVANYPYESYDIVIPELDLNPIYNQLARTTTYVFYVIPDSVDGDRALQWLALDNDGVIIDCSQTDLKLLSGIVYNPNTVIGTLYFSTEGACFLDSYCVGGSNSHDYAVIAEINFRSTGQVDDTWLVDLNRQAGKLLPTRVQSVLEKNPTILQSTVVAGPNGQEYAQHNVMVVDVPIALLVDYGGTFTESLVDKLVSEVLPAHVTYLIRWRYPVVELTGESLSAGNVTLTWTWEGPNCDYRIYRRLNENEDWVLYDTQLATSEADVVYSATETSAAIVYYAVACVVDDQEYPVSNQVGVKVQ